MSRVRDLGDSDLPASDYLRILWHRAFILAWFYNPIKVREHAESIEGILNKYADD